MSAPDGSRRSPVAADHASVTVRRLVRSLLLVVPLAALAYAVLFTAPDSAATAEALRRLRPAFLGLAVAAEAVHLLGLARAYRSGLAAFGAEISYRQQVLAFLAGYGVGPLLPAGGAVGGGIIVQRMIAAGAPRAAAAAAVALTGTLSLLGIAVLVVVGLTIATVTGDASVVALPYAVAALGVLALVVRGLLGLVRSPRSGRWLIARVARPMRRLGGDPEAWTASLDRLRAAGTPSPAAIARIVGWAVLAWSGNATALWLALAGLGGAPTVDVLLVGFGLQHLVAMVPITPSGLGFVEASMAGTFTALGLTGGVAVAGVLIYRLVAFWLPVTIGMVVYVRGLRRPSTTSATTDPATTGAGPDDQASTRPQRAKSAADEDS